ncbi:TAXI family TRAP transporter solute-binding subunit [Actinoallomurus sp. NBC_01490]|uniref:TAXI family TRAP transporter solute-binding subunit n=1 Tax=Actinoallomurus sp. NBC_01490 TaxID=2903557 RepID=UPI002E33FA07|nr:TAXI family TRAP transporter solute-binding subunit [Actinoallomurus sp. NBC_01490]
MPSLPRVLPAVPGSPPARRAVLLAALCLPAGCALVGAEPSYREGPLPIATGAVDGVYYRYARSLAARIGRRLPGVRPSVDSTTGSVDNLRRLTSGRDRLAFVAADAVGAAATARTLRSLARLYDDYIHLVVAGSGPIRSVEDLRGRTVSVGAAGSGVELVAGRVLDAAGLTSGRRPTRVRMGLEESAAALRARRIDAFFWSGGLPTAGIALLARQVPIRLLALGTLAAPIRERYGPYYRAAAIPDGTYDGVGATLTLALANFLLATTSLDDGLAYRVTEILIRDRDAVAAEVPSAEHLDVRDAIQTEPIPLHPGALRYYRSVKP